MDNLPKQYLCHWYHGQPFTAEEADSWWRYLESIKPRQLRFSPEQAYEASREFFADVLPAWRDRHPEYVSLSEEDLWEKLDNFYYNFLRSWRARPSREHHEVVCSAYEAPERTEENTEAMEAREVSCGEIVREGAHDDLANAAAGVCVLIRREYSRRQPALPVVGHHGADRYLSPSLKEGRRREEIRQSCTEELDDFMKQDGHATRVGQGIRRRWWEV